MISRNLLSLNSQSLTLEEKYNAQQYRDSLRAAVRGLWLGVLTLSDFKDSFESSIRRYITDAWETAERRYGVEPEDYSDAEANALADFIDQQNGFIADFGKEIQKGSKAEGGSLDSWFTRVDMWANRYDEAASIARTMAAKDEPLRWMRDRAKDNCVTCKALDGWVKRASYWQKFYEETGLRPKAELLACHGYKCGCGLLPTRLPISRGRPPVVR